MAATVRVAVASLLLAAGASAEPTVSARPAPEATPDGELFQVRLRYGVAVRSGAEQDQGPGLSYSGASPNDLAFAGWWWLLLGRHLGLTATVQREGFSLYDGSTKVTEGGLLRASVGPTGCIGFGPVRLEAAAGYAFAQLPVFGSVGQPTLTPVQRHAVLLAARGLVDVGPVTFEARFEYPITLATSSGASSQGLAAAGAVRVALFRTGALQWGLLAEAAWNQDRLSAAGLDASQSVLRAGGAIDLRWQEEKAVAPRRASVAVRVTAAGVALPGTTVALTVGGARRELVTDAAGVVHVDGLEPGLVVASVAAEGFEPAEERLELTAGQDATIVLSLSKEAPKLGALAVRVTSKVDGTAVPGATVSWADQSRATDASGAVVIDGLAPGPVAVHVTAPGFTPGEEAAAVVAGTTAELSITLVPEQKRLPATIKGQIRNVRGGRPVRATLEIKELKLKLTADADGRFETELPGGRYSVRIAAPGFITQNKQVVVRDGDQVIFNVELFPK